MKQKLNKTGTGTKTIAAALKFPLKEKFEEKK
jgi:hypothetical protein